MQIFVRRNKRKDEEKQEKVNLAKGWKLKRSEEETK